MKKWAALAVAALCLATPVSAWAQNQQASERNLAMAERLITLTMPDVEKQLLDYMRSKLSEWGQEGADEALVRWTEKNVGPIFLPYFRRYMDQLKNLYAREYSEAELQAMLDFYDTPLGRDLAKKQIQLERREAELMNRHMEAYYEDLMQQLCAKFECKAEEPVSTSSAKPARR